MQWTKNYSLALLNRELPYFWIKYFPTWMARFPCVVETLQEKWCYTLPSSQNLLGEKAGRKQKQRHRRELELYKPLNFLPWSKVLEVISAKTLNLALTFRPCEVYSRPITPPNSIKIGTCSCLSECYTYIEKDEKYSGRSVKSCKQNIMEY
jgi:hypothetical protein